MGFLGKIFGPIGFVMAIAKGSLPLAFGATIVTNDLIWWIPFAAILWAAFDDFSRRQVATKTSDNSDAPLETLLGSNGKSLTDMSREKPVLTVLLRHAGCTFHREALADIAAVKHQLKAKDVHVAVVHMGEGDNPIQQGFGDQLTDVVSFSDPGAALYRAFGLERGSLSQLLAPSVWWRGFLAVLRGHGVGVWWETDFRCQAFSW